MKKARTPETAHAKLQVLDEARARWWRRLIRAVNAIDKIDGQRKRLLKPRPLDKLDPPVPPNKPIPPAKAETLGESCDRIVTDLIMGRPTEFDDPLDVRSMPWVKNEADEKAKAELLAAEENKKKAHTKAVAEKRKARLAGELRKMPLTGKAALDAIRNGT